MPFEVSIGHNVADVFPYPNLSNLCSQGGDRSGVGRVSLEESHFPSSVITPGRKIKTESECVS